MSGLCFAAESPEPRQDGEFHLYDMNRPRADGAFRSRPRTRRSPGPLVIRGARTIIVGDTGHGKTALSLQIAAAILTGADVLGYQGASTGPVMVIDLEQGIRSIKRALREASLDDRDDVIYIPVPDGLALDSDPTHLAELERVVDRHRPAVLILDPYYKAHRGDANEERPIVDLMRCLDALRSRYGFALILPAAPAKDHLRTAPARLTLHDVSASGAVVRGAKSLIGIERLSHGYARLRILKGPRLRPTRRRSVAADLHPREGFKLNPKDEHSAERLSSASSPTAANGAPSRNGPPSSASASSALANCSINSSNPAMSRIRSGRPEGSHPRTATELLPPLGRSRATWAEHRFRSMCSHCAHVCRRRGRWRTCGTAPSSGSG